MSVMLRYIDRLSIIICTVLVSAIAMANESAAQPEVSHDSAPAHSTAKIKQQSLSAHYDEDNVVTMPMGCLNDGTLPCVFKSLTRQSLKLNDVQLTLLSGSVVKLSDVRVRPVFEPLKGGFIIEQAKGKVFIKSYELSKFPSYASKTKDQVEVVDGKDFYLIKLQSEGLEKVLLDKDDFVKTLALYFNNKQTFRIKLKEISAIYEKSFRNDLDLQKKIIERKMASVEEAKQVELDKQKAIEEKRKKEQKYFFKRTFER